MAEKEQPSIEKIIELCEKALQENPDNATAHHDLGVALFNRQDIDGALEHLSRAATLAPKSVLSHYLLGIAQGEKGMLDQAVASWKRVLELDKRNAQQLNGMAHYFIGKIYGLKGLWDAAAMEFNRASKIIPQNFLVKNALAEIHLAKGDLVAAKREWLESAELNPADPRAAMNVCAIALDTGDYQLAMETGQQLLAAGHDSAAVRFNLGIANLRLGQPDAAILQLERAVKLEPTDLDCRLNLGEALVKKGQIDAGVKHWEQAASDHPDSPHPLYNIGLTYAQNGLLQRAEEYFAQALQRKPDYLPVFVARGSQYAERGQWAESLAAWQQALLIEPEALIVRLNLMIVHLELKQYAEALGLATGDIAENPDVQFVAALCRLALGQTETAFTALGTLLEQHADVVNRYAALLQQEGVHQALEAAPEQDQPLVQALRNVQPVERQPVTEAEVVKEEKEKGLWSSLLKALRK